MEKGGEGGGLRLSPTRESLREGAPPKGPRPQGAPLWGRGPHNPKGLFRECPFVGEGLPLRGPLVGEGRPQP